MRISRTTTYALQATLHLARTAPGVPVPCRKLAQANKMPERFLLQILRSMVNRGLLQSARGVDGGYFLARMPQQISLCDIVEAFDNSLDAVPPIFDGLRPEIKERLWNTLQKASRLARQELQKVTIADLLTGRESNLPFAVPVPSPRSSTNSVRR